MADLKTAFTIQINEQNAEFVKHSYIPIPVRRKNGDPQTVVVNRCFDVKYGAQCTNSFA